jgi:hypothetical protein
MGALELARVACWGILFCSLIVLYSQKKQVSLMARSIFWLPREQADTDFTSS